MSFILRTNTHSSAKPFVKWLGGKTKLLPQLAALQPKDYQKYYEPFVGGGALFFSIEPPQAVINDLNPHLINLYVQVRDNLDKMLFKLGELIDIYTELDEEAKGAFYYVIRDEFNQRTDDDAWGAALFLFLNKTCYNGVYRENTDRKFNVPFGRRKTTTFHELENIKRASEMLKYTNIFNGGYEDAVSTAEEGDFIYFDPPYVPLSATSNFTQYTGSSFGANEHIKLKEIFEELDSRGCLLMMSNSDTDMVKELYGKFKKTAVLADRTVNCKSQGRGRITELVITNY